MPNACPRSAAVLGRRHVDHDLRRRVADVERPRERRRRDEQVRVPGGVAHGAEPTHREPGDRPTLALRDRAEVRVDERDQLVDVVRLPLRRPALAEVEPVGVEAASTARGHDGDHLVRRGRRRGVTGEGPVELAAAPPVQQVEHRVPLGGRRVVADGQEHPHRGRRAQGRRRDRDVEQAVVGTGHRRDVEPCGVTQDRRRRCLDRDRAGLRGQGRCEQRGAEQHEPDDDATHASGGRPRLLGPSGRSRLPLGVRHCSS